MSAQPPNAGKPVIPLTGRLAVSLPPPPPDLAARLADLERGRVTGSIDGAAAHAAWRAIAADYPAAIDAWAALGESAADQGLWVEAFAFFRVAYHRGLDRLRGIGWGGTGRVPWSDANNRAFLRAVHGLMQASEALGETAEVVRLRKFQLDLDPADNFKVGPIE